ncbi:MAG: hypothetical protein ACK4GW_14040 [Pseudorhodobacter sp.]
MAKEDPYELLMKVDDFCQEFRDEVVEIATDNLRNRWIKEYPNDLVSSYRKDLKFVEAAGAKLEKLLSKIDDPPSQKEVDAYHKSAQVLIDGCQSLDYHNTMFTAYLESEMAEIYSALLTLHRSFLAGIPKRLEKLLDILIKSEKLMKKAESDLKWAKVQKNVNAVITGCATIVSLWPNVKAAKVAYTSAAAALSKLGIDQLMGPSGPGAAGVVKSVVGEACGSAKLLGKVVNNAALAVGAVDGFLSDKGEEDKAKKTLKDLRKQLRAAQDEALILLKLFENGEAKMILLSEQLWKAAKAGADATGRHVEAKFDRLDFLDRIECED